MLSVQAGLQSFDGVHFHKEEEEAEEEEEEEEEQERLGGISERKSILVVSKKNCPKCNASVRAIACTVNYSISQNGDLQIGYKVKGCVTCMIYMSHCIHCIYIFVTKATLNCLH